MLPTAVNEVLRFRPRLSGLLELLSDLTGRDIVEGTREIEEHVAARIFFLLLGEIADAPNFDLVTTRVAQRLHVSASEVADLATSLVDALLNGNASEVGRRESISDLSYRKRGELFTRQGYRCAVCGWDFRVAPGAERTDTEAKATLDHIVSYRLGGDHMRNLWIICGLCNGIKGACLHVGEYGRVWIGNHVYWTSPRTTAFWTFLRDRRCRITSCARGPNVTRLYAVRQRRRGARTLDNLISHCDAHREEADAIHY